VHGVNEAKLWLHECVHSNHSTLILVKVNPHLADQGINVFLVEFTEGLAESIYNLFPSQLSRAITSVIRMIPIGKPLIATRKEVRHILFIFSPEAAGA
jgi:hypothetical protein